MSTVFSGWAVKLRRDGKAGVGSNMWQTNECGDVMAQPPPLTTATQGPLAPSQRQQIAASD